MGMGMSSYPLAFNSYFKKLRNKAMGISMTITGIGPVVMPQLISLLMYQYGIQGAVLILAGISANSFISAMLLQPVKWHMKKKEPEEEDNEKNDEITLTIEEKDMNDVLIKKGKTAHSLKKNVSENICCTFVGTEDDVNSNVIKNGNSLNSLNYDSEIRAIYGFDTPLGGSVLSLTGKSNIFVLEKLFTCHYKASGTKNNKL